MGYNRTPKYRIEILDQAGTSYQIAYDHKLKDFKKFIETYNQSFLTGVNRHIGFRGCIKEAKLVQQKGRIVKSEVCCGLRFEVV